MPIGFTTGHIPPGALEIVREFLKHAVDVPNEEKARACLCKGSLAAGGFEMPPPSPTASYTIGEPTAEDGQIYVLVTLSDSANGMSMGAPMAPVMEDGAWKLDMEKMMAKLMGGSMGQIVEQMTGAMSTVMEGIGEALGSALGGLGQAMSGASAPAAGPVAAADREKIEKRIADVAKELEQRHDISAVLDIDLPSLLTGETEEANRRLVDSLDRNILLYVTYALSEASKAFPFEGRVKAIRLEGIADPKDRIIFSEGARIIYRLTLAEGGYYDGQELTTLVTGVAAGMDESAPPGPAKTGASYAPTSDAAKTVKDYREFVEPVLTRRISQMLGKTIEIQVDWDAFADDTVYANALWTWGLNRICGALQLLLVKAENRPPLAEAIDIIRLLTIPRAGMKAVELNPHELWVYFAPSEGEKGCYYESEIAEILTTKLKLRTRPRIAELERYAKTWEKSLQELFGTEIKYAFDWDGFTCMDENKNTFALSQIKEVGIDFIYYAISNLAEKNPNFKQQFPTRIKWIYLEHTPRSETKGVRGEQTTIGVRLHLHEGYDGYLTIKDLEKALPAVVANMPDIIPEPPAAADEEELHELSAMAKREEELLALRQQTEIQLARYSQSLEPVIGNAVPIEILWTSLEGGAMEARDFIHFALAPLTSALAMVKGDTFMLSAVAAMIDKIVVEQADCEEGHQITLESRVVTVAIFREEGFPVMTGQEMYQEIRNVLGAPAAEKRAAEAMRRLENLKPQPPEAPEPEQKSPPKKAAPKKKSPGKLEKKSEKKSPPKKKKKK